ncbi:MAG TPA: hypothetical protein VFF29_01355 [Bacteroidota bacterium]|nr:hypothetical protein [Bacteroidota bacterium]
MHYVVLSLLLSATILGFQKQTGKFSGYWKMDLKKSTNLPESFKRVESYVMEVKQSSDSMVVVTEVKGSGQRVKLPSTVYKFDGKEIYSGDTLQGFQRWTKCDWISKEQKLVVIALVVQRIGPYERRYSQKDVWQIVGKDRLDVSMIMKFENPDSTQREKRVYHRLQ